MGKAKRDREEPCFICNHYHDYHGGEECGVCGHVKGGGAFHQDTSSKVKDPTLILNNFLFLGGYDAASRCELLKASGVSHILNCVPTLEVLYKTSFTYHTVSRTPPPFDECFRFLDSCQRNNQRVLVYCMTGTKQSPGVVIAYLMKLKDWRLPESFRWVKDRRPTIKLSDQDFERLRELEVELFGRCSVEGKEELDGLVQHAGPHFSDPGPLTFGQSVGNGSGNNNPNPYTVTNQSCHPHFGSAQFQAPQGGNNKSGSVFCVGEINGGDGGFVFGGQGGNFQGGEPGAAELDMDT